MLQNSKNIKPVITILGAGPGDAELITVKGIKALGEADVVLYDALVNTELLKYAPSGAKKIFVGKKASNHSFSQDEINHMIVEYALSSGNVVRLKGGDPFVFGRGHEELSYIESYFEAAGISEYSVNVIPGISSSYAVPELQHIPLTKRGVSESFWVITAVTSHGTLSSDLYDAARSNATVIILMGLNRIKEIADIFIDAGRQYTAAAVIENGSLPDERAVISTIENITAEVKEKNIGSPAVIVIGNVVELHKKYSDYLQASVLHSLDA